VATFKFDGELARLAETAETPEQHGRAGTYHAAYANKLEKLLPLKNPRAMWTVYLFYGHKLASNLHYEASNRCGVPSLYTEEFRREISAAARSASVAVNWCHGVYFAPRPKPNGPACRTFDGSQSETTSTETPGLRP
jgi:hypothetical protein